MPLVVKAKAEAGHGLKSLSYKLYLLYKETRMGSYFLMISQMGGSPCF